VIIQPYVPGPRRKHLRVSDEEGVPLSLGANIKYSASVVIAFYPCPVAAILAADIKEGMERH
jgi:hypothetical protein